ncbi:very short patch repair endonuclease [Alloyangia pacifica]|uniref:very short patch repair endonuclease n=1 Tax=Alloyangia pacifica TaxID=311180 RepID=UPI001CFE4CDE|nr:very short patch repair endonuclease [Alloyangia pacifica]
MTRSAMMAGIGSKNTKPELVIRKGLHKFGFRYRLHRKDLPGKPDIVLPKYQSVIFVHGCFWHGHEGCSFFKVPKTNTEFWLAKIRRNQVRDAEVQAKLMESGWRVLTVWECATRRVPEVPLTTEVADWLAGSDYAGNISERDFFPPTDRIDAQ